MSSLTLERLVVVVCVYIRLRYSCAGCWGQWAHAAARGCHQSGKNIPALGLGGAGPRPHSQVLRVVTLHRSARVLLRRIHNRDVHRNTPRSRRQHDRVIGWQPQQAVKPFVLPPVPGAQCQCPQSSENGSHVRYMCDTCVLDGCYQCRYTAIAADLHQNVKFMYVWRDRRLASSRNVPAESSSATNVMRAAWHVTKHGLPCVN